MNAPTAATATGAGRGTLGLGRSIWPFRSCAKVPTSPTGCSSRADGPSAFVQVVCESYVRGVSTRRIEGLVRTLGIERISKSRVSEMAKELDQAVESFRTRPLDGAPYTYVWLDAFTRRCARAAGSATWPAWSRPVSTPPEPGRSWALSCTPPRMAPAGPRSFAASLLEALRGCVW